MAILCFVIVIVIIEKLKLGEVQTSLDHQDCDTYLSTMFSPGSF